MSYSTSRTTPRMLAAVLCTSLMSGCMTFDTRVNPAYSGPPAYGGVRLAVGNVRSSFMRFDVVGLALSSVDVLLCLIADTFLLPVTAFEQTQWNEARANRQRLDLEQPSLVFPAQNEDPLRTARRLFKACENLARNLNPTYIDCYSINAQIEITDEDGDTRKLNGKDYKEEVKGVILAVRGGTRFVRYLEPTFELEGNRVRIRAIREDAGIRERSPIEFVFGASEDGGWRILEERSRGWR